MTKQNSSDVVKAFEDLKDQKVQQGQDGSLSEQIMDVFKAYPDTVFTQRQFADRLDKSNVFVNHVLRGLLDKGLITRVGSRRQYYYSLAK